MHEEELKKKQDDAVKKLWIPQAALALRCMEEAERSNNSVRQIKQELTIGSFSGPSKRVTVKIPDPEKKKKRIEVIYNFDSFKSLLAQPMPSSDETQDAGEEDVLVDGPEKNQKKGCCCFLALE